MTAMDLRGLSPAPVTAFKPNGDLDFESNVRIAKWLASFEDVKSLVILGHAGEGTYLTEGERLDLIRAYVDAVDVPVVAGITGEGTKVAAEEAKKCATLVQQARWFTRTMAGCGLGSRRELLKIAIRRFGSTQVCKRYCSSILMLRRRVMT